MEKTVPYIFMTLLSSISLSLSMFSWGNTWGQEALKRGVSYAKQGGQIEQNIDHNEYI